MTMSAAGTSTSAEAGASGSAGTSTAIAGDSSGGTGGHSHAGQAGSAGQASAAAGSGGAAVLGQACSPGTLVKTPYGFDAGNCYYWDQTHEGIPNTQEISLRYIDLPTPTVPGQAYALSLGFASAGIEQTLELWGSDAACGNADELLWWGAMRSGEICTEFKATRAFSHLLMVWRPLWRRDANAEHDTITFCPTGSCGTEHDGQGLGIEGDPITAPVGGFYVSAGIKAGPLDFDAKVGYGWLHVEGRQSIALGGTAAVDSGYFRMQTTEGFDDAWYCPGPGSTFTWLQAKRAHFDFSGVTKLADCKNASGGTGTATFSAKTDVGAATMTSSISSLADANAEITSGGCPKGGSAAPCDNLFEFSDGRGMLRLHAFQAPTTRMQGQDLIQDFTDTALIFVPQDGSSPQIACAGGGTVTFSADGSHTISLSQITPFASCPGETLTTNKFSGDLFF